jgi:hypothetical protein
MKTGIELIAHERERQIAVEGWNAAHDDSHQNYELSRAAASYAEYVHGRAWVYDEGNFGDYRVFPGVLFPKDWPDDWSPDWFKPKSPVRDLVRAGALIAAEIDRLQRLETNEKIGAVLEQLAP